MNKSYDNDSERYKREGYISNVDSSERGREQLNLKRNLIASPLHSLKHNVLLSGYITDLLEES